MNILQYGYHFITMLLTSCACKQVKRDKDKNDRAVETVYFNNSKPNANSYDLL